MSIALIYDIQTEVRRLMIAGSELATGDFRLSKLLPVLKKAGESVSVFARVVECIEKVVEPGQGKAEKLLDLANIVSAILYTQGETGCSGPMQDIDIIDVNHATALSYRKLSPIIEALTTKGSGRYEIIKTAYETKLVNDFRLINPLIIALGDSYSEIPDLAYEMLKGYGNGIIPLLEKRLDLDGGKSAGRIVDLLFFYKGTMGKELYVEALAKGCLEVRVSAINALKDIPECETILLELASDRKKEIREAALNALSVQTSDIAATCLFKAFKGKDRQMSLDAVKNSKAPIIINLLLQEGEMVLQEALQITPNKETTLVIAADSVEQKVIDYFFDILECLKWKNNEDIFNFLKKCLENTAHLSKFKHSPIYRNTYQQDYGIDRTIARAAANTMLTINSDAALCFLVNQAESYDNHLLGFAFTAALKSCSSEYVFDHYARYATGKRKNPVCLDVLTALDVYIKITQSEVALHEDWLNVFIANDETELVCTFIPVGSSIGIDYLQKCLKNVAEKQFYKYKLIIKGLLRAKYEKTHGIMEDKLKTLLIAKNTGYYYNYYLREFAELARLMPTEFAKVLEDAATNYEGDTSSILLEAAYDLKNVHNHKKELENAK